MVHTLITSPNIPLFMHSTAAPDVNHASVLLERTRSEGISTPSKDDDSTLLNPSTHRSNLDGNTKSDPGLPEVSGNDISLTLESLIAPSQLPVGYYSLISSLFFRGGLSRAAFASPMERVVLTTSWFTGSPTRSQRRGSYLSGTSEQRAYRWKRR